MSLRSQSKQTDSSVAPASPDETVKDLKTEQNTHRLLAITYKPLAELVPYARNARTHTQAQIEKLKASLAKFGWTNPVLTAGNDVLAGHARLAAAAGMAETGQPIAGNADPLSVPTVDLSHLSRTERRAYIVADNRLALDAGWDESLLRLEFQDMQNEGFDLGLTGFELPEITTLFSNGPAAPEGFQTYDENIETDHQCPKCGYVFSGGKTVPRESGGNPD